MPQVAVQVHRPFDSRRAVVFDARDVEGPLVVHDVHAGATTLSTLLRPDAPQAFVPILNALRAGLLEVRINGVLTSPQSVLGVTADVVLFGHVRDLPEAPRPVARPPTPPRPVEFLPLESESHRDSTASASTASFSVVFGDTPPPRRWSRHPSAASSARASDVAEAKRTALRSEADSPGECTIFDPVRQFEVATTPACKGSSLLLEHALSKARHLGLHPDGRVLNHVLPGLPRPQVCIHSAVHANIVVLPVYLEAGQYCTLAMERSASAFELAIRLEAVCGMQRAYRQLLARGWLSFLVNGVRTGDPFSKDSLLFADSAQLVKSPEIDPELFQGRLRPLRPHPSTGEGCLTVHSPGQPPRHVHVSPFAPPHDVHQQLQQGGLIAEAGLALPLDVSPVQGSDGAHFLALDATQIKDGRPWFVFDLRRIVHPR